MRANHDLTCTQVWEEVLANNPQCIQSYNIAQGVSFSSPQKRRNILIKIEWCAPSVRPSHYSPFVPPQWHPPVWERGCASDATDTFLSPERITKTEPKFPLSPSISSFLSVRPASAVLFSEEMSDANNVRTRDKSVEYPRVDILAPYLVLDWKGKVVLDDRIYILSALSLLYTVALQKISPACDVDVMLTSFIFIDWSLLHCILQWQLSLSGAPSPKCTIVYNTCTAWG